MLVLIGAGLVAVRPGLVAVGQRLVRVGQSLVAQLWGVRLRPDRRLHCWRGRHLRCGSWGALVLSVVPTAQARRHSLFGVLRDYSPAGHTPVRNATAMKNGY